MWRSKKFVIAAVLAGVLLVGSIGGVVLASDGGGSSQPGVAWGALCDRVAAIYKANTGDDIDPAALEAAFAQARDEIRAEALDNYLQKLVEEGKITQSQADQYKEWLQSRPDITPYRQHLREWQQSRPDMPPELKDWLQNRPDVPMPRPFGRHGGFQRMGGMLGHGGPYAPAE